MELPPIRCFIAFPFGGGEICRVTHIVDLQEAFIRMAEGWQVIGPDPEDYDAYLARKAEYDAQTIYDATPDSRKWWKRL